MVTVFGFHAVNCYRYWQRELGRDDFRFGQFAENFTLEGLPDDEVCIGDRYRIGSARHRAYGICAFGNDSRHRDYLPRSS